MKSLLSDVSIARETAFFAEKLKLDKQKYQEMESVYLDLQEDELTSLLEEKDNEVRILQDEQNTFSEVSNSMLQIGYTLLLLYSQLLITPSRHTVHHFSILLDLLPILRLLQKVLHRQ
eukprot:gene24875-33365_t